MFGGKYTFGLRFSLTSFAVLIVILCSAFVVGYNYSQNTKLARESTHNYVTNVISQIELQARELIAPVPALLNSVSTLSKHLKFDEAAKLEILELIDPILTEAPQLTSVYYGTETGSFTQFVSFVGKSDVFAYPYRATGDHKFAIVTSEIAGPHADVRRINLIEWRRDGTQGRSWQEKTSYDPRHRPWYGPAKSVDSIFRTSPYLFSKSQKPGITFSRKLKGSQPGVAGVDLDLRTLKAFLLKSKITPGTLLAVVSVDGKILGHTDSEGVEYERLPNDKRIVRMLNMNERVDDPLLTMMDNISSLEDNTLTDIEVGGKQYVGKTIKISMGGTQPERLIIAVPWHEIIAPLIASRERSLWITLLIIILIVGFAVVVAQLISKPVEALRIEADKLSRLDLNDKSDPIKSSIREIDELSHAMHATRAALQTFSKYVPRSLVRKLMESGEGGELGGERREIVVMFSDIENFTTITEDQDPLEMMDQLSVYFESQSSSILENKGTIDKFIGDSVMAFWNAPELDADKTRNSCIAILTACDRLRGHNVNWEKEGKSRLDTRYAVHCGVVLVGNVGSSNRMDYTVMGGDVNLASRLEGLNKVFGTQVIGSQPVVESAGDEFLWRKIGLVMPKGTHHATVVYELVGLRKPIAGVPKIGVVDVLCIDKVQLWNDAFDAYLDRDWKSARKGMTDYRKFAKTDKAADLYLKRIDQYVKQAPPASWNGHEKFQSK